MANKMDKYYIVLHSKNLISIYVICRYDTRALSEIYHQNNTNMHDAELASFTADGLMFSCLFTSRLGR